MEIRCPECAYSREVDEASLRPSLTMATCPQCGARFRFREPEKADFVLEPESDRPLGGEADALSGRPASEPIPGEGTHKGDRPSEASARRAPGEEGQSGRHTRHEGYGLQDAERPDDHEGDGGDAGDGGDGEERAAPGYGNRMEPWAYVREAGFVPAFVETTRQILLAPQYFFSSLGKDVPFVYPFAYYLLVSVIGILAETLWQTVVGNPILPEAFSGAVESPGELAAILMFSPVIMTLYLYVLGGVLHLVLVLTGVTRGSANTTLRVVCYSGAADLLSLVPVVGTLLGGLVRLWIITVGLKAAYGTGYGRILPALGVLLLVLFIFVLVVMRDAGVV